MEKIKEKIKEDLVLAMKSKETLTLSVLRMLLSSILLKEKDKNYQLRKENDRAKDVELTDEEVLKVIFSEVKKRKDSVLAFQKGNREDLVKKESEEIAILEKYLPRQLTEEEIKEIAEKLVKRGDNFGEAMSKVIQKISGRADGAKVSKAVKEILGIA
ncbi:MAG: GatB/YqeY domain-containing protein [Candidatus Pacebacteria bacterium]|nr:GatB/YqeY domain-containing protein [Candidatus Paceibacterota bacterium]MDD3072347.1 GatB/YqeY domain-containing protein [Candidatus Paceibacterota bacterium]MDD3728723.1 GatB/YqeY domain-containing protein [Candidatus Paceibacterota bacterium]MDD4201419.1 GatB/YqeY domain-containing protein [Candidatus Paceibacterota bacterium]MDD4897207.1 GatB/YqeY domain-containing protein [Candidatus Paceibacterota bacterium]